MKRNRRLVMERLEDRTLLSVSPVGDALSGNSHSEGTQQLFAQCRAPAIAQAATGELVSVWASEGQDGDDMGVYGQLLDSAGAPIRSEFRVNTATTAAQTFPSVAMDDDGDFVVTWSSSGQDGSGYGVYAQRFDATGTAQGTEFRVNSHVVGNQNFSAVAIDSDGDFLITWTSADQDGSGAGIFGQCYQADGTTDGDEFQVNTTTDLNQRYSTVAMNSTGHAVVTWTSQNQDGSSGGIYAQRYDVDGSTLGDEFLVNETTEGNQQLSAVVMRPGGGFAVAWQAFDTVGGNWNVYARLYGPSGTASTGEVHLGVGRTVTLGATSDQGFVAGWESGGLPTDLVLQHYNMLGIADGDEILIHDGSAHYEAPSMAARGDSLAVVWSSDPLMPSSDGEDINVQRFDVVEAVVSDQPPQLDPIENQSITERDAVSLTAVAHDPDGSVGDLVFSLVGDTSGVIGIDPVRGDFFWATSDEEGGTVRTFTICVTDSGDPGFYDTVSFDVEVLDDNFTPMPNQVPDQTVPAGAQLTVVVEVTDVDIPVQSHTYSLSGEIPAGAEIDAITGIVTWTPLLDEQPGPHTITVEVTDDGEPPETGLMSFEVTVTESVANQSPVLGPIADQTVARDSLLSVTATATDLDDPAQTLTYALIGPVPGGASIDSSTGEITWTPDGDNEPGTYRLTVQATDDGTTPLHDTVAFNVTVTVITPNTNEPPLFDPIADASVEEGQLLSLPISTTDPDGLVGQQTFDFVGATPPGAEIDSITGLFTWTPTEADGPKSYSFTVQVTDSGPVEVTRSTTFQIDVLEKNQPPVLDPISDQSVIAGQLLTLDITATDPDLPLNTLTFSLGADAPTGATLDALTGQFNWTPPADHIVGDISVTVHVTDDVSVIEDGAFGHRDSLSFTITVQSASTQLWLEAESGLLNTPMETASDAGASAGGYIWTPSGTTGSVQYAFTVDTAEEYAIWGRTLSEDVETDSFFVQVDDGPLTVWDTPVQLAWTWGQVADRASGPLTYQLSAGQHTLTFSTREAGTRLDRLLITNDLSEVPSGNGGGLGDPTPETVDDSGTLWLEAESGQISLMMEAASDATASAGQYVWTPSGTSGSVEYTFSLSAAGDYSVWGRVLAANVRADSFFVQVDDGPLALWDTPVASDWTWGQVSDRESGPLAYSLSAGEHTLTFFTRETGTRLDNLLITDDPASVPEANRWLEAESGQISLMMEAASDVTASSGQYVWTPSGTSGSIKYTFSVDTAGDYAVWGRTLARDGKSDSFFVQVDDGPPALWDTRVDSDWAWGRVSDRGAGASTYQLSVGEHTLTIFTREAGTRLDHLLVTNNFSYVPSGTGGVLGELTPAVVGVSESPWFEAESGVVTYSMMTASDADASSGKYVGTPAGASGSVSYTLSVDTPGDYAIWGRTWAPNGNANSFFVQMDDGPLAVWDTPVAADWTWGQVSDRASGTLTYSLSAGEHTLTFFTREVGTRLDNLLITADLSEVPSGTGGQPAVVNVSQSPWIEAESGALVFPMATGSDGNASSGRYVWTPSGTSGSVRYSFSVDTAGDYAIWARTFAPDGETDSFFVQMDDGPLALWDTTVGPDWAWGRVSDRALGALTCPLSAGEHTLTLFTREVGTRLDRLAIVGDEVAAIDQLMALDGWEV